jgi:hypothetical protein
MSIESEMDATSIKVYDVVKGSRIPSRKLVATWYLKDGVWLPHGNQELPDDEDGWKFRKRDEKADRKVAEEAAGQILARLAKAAPPAEKKAAAKRNPPKKKVGDETAPPAPDSLQEGQDGQ